jgi:hypothetical protein
MRPKRTRNLRISTSKETDLGSDSYPAHVLRLRTCCFSKFVITNLKTCASKTNLPKKITFTSLESKSQYVCNHLPWKELISLRSGRSANCFVRHEVVGLDPAVTFSHHPRQIPMSYITKYCVLSYNTFVLTKGVYCIEFVRLIVSNFILYPRFVLTQSGRHYRELMNAKPNWLIKSIRNAINHHSNWRGSQQIKSESSQTHRDKSCSEVTNSDYEPISKGSCSVESEEFNSEDYFASSE